MSSSAARVLLALGLFGLAACSPAEAAREAQPPAAQATPAAFQVENSAVLPLKSAVLNRDYEVYVKTPPGYGKPENTGKRYPVIYLTDGPYTFQVASGISRLTFSQGLLNEFVIVGVSWGSGEPPADSRRRDLTPWPNKAIKGATGGGPAYLTFLKTEVMPLVEAATGSTPPSAPCQASPMAASSASGSSSPSRPCSPTTSSPARRSGSPSRRS